jgi:hypothetical protein
MDWEYNHARCSSLMERVRYLAKINPDYKEKYLKAKLGESYPRSSLESKF